MTRKGKIISAVTAAFALIAVILWHAYPAARQEYLNSNLIAAIQRDDAQRVRALLTQGADPNTLYYPEYKYSSAGKRFLHIFWHNRPEPKTALWVALSPDTNGCSHCPLADPGVIQALLDKGANANDSYENYTTLCMAVMNGDSHTFNLLLGKGADINARSAYGDTPLMLASEVYEQPNLVKILLDQGANVNAQDVEFGDTALMRAIRGSTNNIMRASSGRQQWTMSTKQMQIIRLLLAHHASVTVQNRNGDTALTLAQYRQMHYPQSAGLREVVHMLKAAGEKR